MWKWSASVASFCNSMFVWALFRTGLTWGRTDWLPMLLCFCVYLGWRGAVLVWGSEGSAVESLYECLNIPQPPSWEYCYVNVECIFLFHCSRLWKSPNFRTQYFFAQSYVFRHPPVKSVFSVVRFGDWCLAGQEPPSSSFPVLCGVLNMGGRTLLCSLQITAQISLYVNIISHQK
jgi:hypothetical protein